MSEADRGNEIVIRAAVQARLLGIRLLKLDATVVLAHPTDQPIALTLSRPVPRVVMTSHTVPERTLTERRPNRGRPDLADLTTAELLLAQSVSTLASTRTGALPVPASR